jgi:hypothetical protein
MAKQIFIQVRDISGHIMISEKRSVISGNSLYEIDVKKLARGTYLLTVQYDGMNQSKKFIRQ